MAKVVERPRICNVCGQHSRMYTKMRGYCHI